MNVWAMIPMKPLAQAKTRLSAVLTDAERAELARAMLRQVLRVVVPQRRLCGALVVSRDPEVLAVAQAMGAEALHEPPHSDLNAALLMGAAALRRRGAGLALVLPGDLPFITEWDVTMLLDHAAMAGLVIAPDAERTGTNALIAPLPLPFQPQYGVQSFHRHLQRAHEAGLLTRVVTSDTLALDVDTPNDLVLYHQRLALGTATPDLPRFDRLSRHA
ncbi:MAG: 2-phospho-L-lactate guanylyltransferase [Anaerolineae bacterium]